MKIYNYMNIKTTDKAKKIKYVLIIVFTSMMIIQSNDSYGWNPIFLNTKSHEAMLPTIKRWKNFVIDHPGRYSNISIGDIIAFYYPKNTSLIYIDRVVGIPGETIRINKNRLYINGNIIPQKYIGPFSFRSHGYTIHGREYEQQLGQKKFDIVDINTPEANFSFGPYKIPNNCYYVLGDDRDNSDDSRFFGCVQKQNILGKIHLYKLINNVK